MIKYKSLLMFVRCFILFFSFVFVTASTHAATIYRYQDNGQCDLKVREDKKWVSISDATPLFEQKFTISDSMSKDTHRFFKVRGVIYAAKNACLISTSISLPTAIKPPIVIEEEKEEVKVKNFSPRNISLGFLYFTQDFTTKGSDGLAYPLNGKFIGITAGLNSFLSFKMTPSLRASLSAEPFFGYVTVNEDNAGTPAPTFSYKAKNYFEYGIKLMPGMDLRIKEKFILSLQVGGGVSFSSLPAPNGPISFNKPDFMSYFLQSGLTGSFYINPKTAIYAGGGTLGFTHPSAQIGLRRKI